jgi:hypothetical protein
MAYRPRLLQTKVQQGLDFGCTLHLGASMQPKVSAQFPVYFLGGGVIKETTFICAARFAVVTACV